ncbi:arsenic resistance protein [Parenemella sanctibonifatiensis]|nr:bile acid:sodium symporter [Parenemella sanctibonifatiensis]
MAGAAQRMERAAEWMERHQVALCLTALALGAGLGLGLPSVARPAAVVITPTLALLLLVTFVGIPFARIATAWRNGRFLAVLLGLNFVVAPLVAYAVSRLVADDVALVTGVLLVLLAPCVDYVIVFTGLAGGDREGLLAATPLLMLAQMVLLPLQLRLLGGGAAADAIAWGPFLMAFVVVILVPLLAAGLLQLVIPRVTWGGRLESALQVSMVPLMMATLTVVVASQIGAVGARLEVLRTVPAFVVFAMVMAVLGLAAGRLVKLDVPGRRAAVFSGVTRNSLVVLPLALAMPPALGSVPLVVVTQTMVELVVMVVLVGILGRNPGSAEG